MQHAQFATYFKEQYPLWCRFVAGLLQLRPDNPDVESIVQEGVVNLMSRGGGVEAIDEESPDPLFFAAIRNAVRDSKRREKHHRTFLERTAQPNTDQVDPKELEATDDELLALHDAVRDALRQAVQHLSSTELRATRAWVEAGVRSKAVEQLGISGDDDAIRILYDQPLHRAKRKIQVQLGPLYDRAMLLGFDEVLQMLREAAEWAQEARTS